MTKLSPHYLSDDPDALPSDVRAYLDEQWLPRLAHVQVPHPKLLVVFAGGNAIGKTALSRRIQDDLQALVLENDSIKRSIVEYMPTIDRDQRNRLSWQYSMDLYRRLDTLTPNGLVVRDGVITWYYDRILPLFQQQGYELFVVGYELSREKQIECIKARGDTDILSAQKAIELLVDQDIHMARFASEYAYDVTLTDDTLFDHDIVIEALRERLNTLS